LTQCQMDPSPVDTTRESKYATPASVAARWCPSDNSNRAESYLAGPWSTSAKSLHADRYRTMSCRRLCGFIPSHHHRKLITALQPTPRLCVQWQWQTTVTFCPLSSLHSDDRRRSITRTTERTHGPKTAQVSAKNRQYNVMIVAFIVRINYSRSNATNYKFNLVKNGGRSLSW